MKKSQIYIILMICLLLFTFILIQHTVVESFSKKNILTFDSTQKWDNRYLKQINSLSKDTKNKIKNVLHMDYHTKYEYPNVLKQVHTDITDLLQKKKLRTKERIQEISTEVSNEGLIRKFNIKDKNTRQNILRITYKLNPIVLYIKQHYNRVRPSFVNKNIQPVVEIPSHPSYPSGHAISAFVTAYLLPKKDLQQNLKIAERIALNREIGGVHYKSDTDYSRTLAPKILNLYNDLYK
jgi:hypothetical protein